MLIAVLFSIWVVKLNPRWLQFYQGKFYHRIGRLTFLNTISDIPLKIAGLNSCYRDSMAQEAENITWVLHKTFFSPCVMPSVWTMLKIRLNILFIVLSKRGVNLNILAYI